MSEILSLIFSYSFILYLILFLLETIFPGFVSNNFSLNYVLIPVLFFGVLSAIFPPAEEEDKQKKPASKFDLIVLVVLSVGSFLLIFYKFKIDSLILKLTVSLLSSILTLVLGVLLLYFPDEQEGREVKEAEVNWALMIRRAFASRLHIPVPLALLFVIITLIFIPKNTMKILHTPNAPSIIKSPAAPAVTMPKADPNVHIFVYNAGAETGDAKRFSDIFRNNGFTNITTRDYPGSKIENARIQFRPSEASQAALIEDFLKNIYTSVTKTPYATDSADIRVLLGSYLSPQDTDTLMENENVDFFFQ
jgi:hypothetical protein